MPRVWALGFACVFAGLSTASADWKDAPETKALYEAAKAEKTVMVWGPQRSEVEWIPAAFTKAFPGVAVQFLGADMPVLAGKQQLRQRHALPGRPEAGHAQNCRKAGAAGGKRSVQ